MSQTRERGLEPSRPTPPPPRAPRPSPDAVRSARAWHPGPRPTPRPPAASVVHRGPGPLDRRGLRWLRADAAGLIQGGDTAIVATQYSYLPSWLSFLVDGGRADEEGRQLFDAVHNRIAAMPPGVPRPRLVTFGESLGSQGSEAAFSSLADVRAQADGALWVGPPHGNRLFSQLVERRDPGTREVAPTYADGLVVRFSRPDWLVEPRGDDVLVAMSWYPVVTFWQVTVDLAAATSVPDGHGHVYASEMLDGWVAVATPDGWTPTDTERARAVAVR